MNIRAISRPPTRPVVEIEVTPNVAQILLANEHPMQRHKKAIVRRYRRDMEAERWPIDWGVPFAFDRQGRLINGKQRCEAVIESGRTIIVLATLDHDEGDIHIFDPVASARNLGDVYSMHGVRNAVRAGAAVRWIWRYITGQMHSATTVPNDRGVKFQLANQDLEEAVSLSGRFSRYIDGGPMGGFVWMFSLVNQDATQAFCDALDTGLNLTAESPVWVLRRKFEHALGSRRERTLPMLTRLALLVITWNRYIDELPASKLSWLGGPFPKIRGLENMKAEDIGF